MKKKLNRVCFPRQHKPCMDCHVIHWLHCLKMFIVSRVMYLNFNTRNYHELFLIK